MRKLKRGLVASALACVFAFATPLWAGCFGGGITKDKATAKVIIENAQTKVNTMFNDAVTTKASSNEENGSPLLSSANGEADFESGLIYEREKYSVYGNVMAVNLGLELAKMVVDKDAFNLNASFTNTINPTEVEITTLKNSMKSSLKNNVTPPETTYKCNLYFSESNNTLYTELYMTYRISDSVTAKEYVKAEIGFDNNKKATSYKAAVVSYGNVSGGGQGYTFLYFEGVNYTDSKFMYAIKQNDTDQRYLLGPPTTSVVLSATSAKKALVDSYCKAMDDMMADTTAKTIEGTNSFTPFSNAILQADAVVYAMEQADS